jgi:hypothetical protein
MPIFGAFKFSSGLRMRGRLVALRYRRALAARSEAMRSASPHHLVGAVADDHFAIMLASSGHARPDLPDQWRRSQGAAETRSGDYCRMRPALEGRRARDYELRAGTLAVTIVIRRGNHRIAPARHVAANCLGLPSSSASIAQPKAERIS